MQQNLVLAILKFLKSEPPPAKVVILENVWGVMMRSKRMNLDAPIHSIMNSKAYGLHYLSNYWVSEVLSLRADNIGLPHSRRRVFIVLMAKRYHSLEAVQRVISNVRLVAERRLFIAPLQTWMHSPSSEDEVDCKLRCKKARNDADEFPPKSAQLCRRFRREHDLPTMNDVGGQPFSDSAPDHVLAKTSRYQREVADIAVLYIAQFRHAATSGNLDDLLVDISQNPTRLPWRCDGKIQSLSTSSKLVFRGELVGFKALFGMMGWPHRTFIIPEGLSTTDMTKLLGNMLCPPMVGAVMASAWAVTMKRSDPASSS